MTGSVSLFGKLPTHGDFVARGLSAGDRDALDAWLSGSMAEAAALYEDFDARYDAAPPWRHAGPAGGGAICASVDAAGRRFPLVLLGPAGEACEALLYRALGEAWDADRLHVEAGGLAASPSDVALWWTEGSDPFPPARREGERPPALIAAMLDTQGDAP
ncbi:type VI secretion system-associated protein TagF [Sphingomonas sp. Y38-1Y]|uniref:type VI secretion system-associated protein TagF n=1 Tax=Sphingomonas sp. Y38-1Y TaxID=3078265 RepID=UPI0028E542D6|nr:type VI secretion system-associated protein TagF [Sphingomonas sp. Y38-1Y]